MYTLGGRPRAGDMGLDGSWVGQVTGRGVSFPFTSRSTGPGRGGSRGRCELGVHWGPAPESEEMSRTHLKRGLELREGFGRGRASGRH